MNASFTETLYARAGSGFSGGGGGHACGGYSGFAGHHANNFYQGNIAGYNHFLLGMLILGLLVIIGGIIFIKNRMYSRKQEAKNVLDKAVSRDAEWNETKIKDYVRSTFIKIQNAWANNDLEYLRNALTRNLYNDWKNTIDYNRLHSIKNKIESIDVKDIEFICVVDKKDNSKDKFIVEIQANMIDKSTFAANGITKDNSGRLSEYWTFNRFGNEWKLGDVIGCGIFNEWKVSDEVSRFDK